MAQIAIFIETNDDKCSFNCPFLDDNECLLFRVDLEDEKLPKNTRLQDEAEPYKMRSTRCLRFDFN